MKIARFRKLGAATLIEVLVIVAITLIVAAASFGAIVNYYETSILNVDVSNMINIVRRTRQRAIGNDSSSDYSIKFLLDRFVVFPGANYDPANSENEDHYLDTGVIVSTTFPNDEITFNNFTGRANSGGAVVISAFSISKTLTVNELGIVQGVN